MENKGPGGVNWVQSPPLGASMGELFWCIIAAGALVLAIGWWLL